MERGEGEGGVTRNIVMGTKRGQMKAVQYGVEKREAVIDFFK